MNRINFATVNPAVEADMVIIGAGVSGLYCAWRLIQDEPNRRITIVERLNRTGGRLDSDLIEIKPGQVVREEEGGMRFNTGMVELMRLTHALGLCDDIVPFPMASDVPNLGNTNRFHLRGHGFTAEEGAAGIKGVWASLYDLNEMEQGQSPTDIVTRAYNAVLAHNHKQSPKLQTPEFWTEFREQYSWNGTPLYEWQLWGLLRDMGHSEECIQMLTETIGFQGPFKAPVNAGDAFQILADFPVDPHYLTFRRGFSTLPNAIEEALDGKVDILLGTNVNRIVDEKDGFELTITEAPEHQNSNPYIPGGVTKTITAKTVIVAVGTTGMEQLFNTSPTFNAHAEAERLWNNIHSARGMNLQKINLYFDSAWWLDGTVEPPVQFGPSFTNLPINAVYPFYAIDDHDCESAPDATTQAAALTIYCDLENTTFWAGLQNVGPKFSSSLQSAEDARRPQRIYPASRQVVAEARRQIARLFGIAETPEPVLTSYRLWDGSDDFEHAYHQWRVGIKDSEVRGYLANPINGVHFCNEAISDMHGWVNGSIRSSDLVLAHFGIEPLCGDTCTPTAQSGSTGSGAATKRAGALWGA